MSDDSDKIRIRATRLFALALKAREEGQSHFAEELTRLAAEAFDQATQMERTEAPQQGAVQPQQPQPKAPKRDE